MLSMQEIGTNCGVIARSFLFRAFLLSSMFMLVGLSAASEPAWACHPNPYDPSCYAPFNFSPPQIVGVAENGETLTVCEGDWQWPSSFSYQWRVCTPSCSDIEDATERTYLLGDDEVGYTVQAVVTAHGSDPDHSTPAATQQSDLIEGAVINGTSALRPSNKRNLGLRYLCQNLGPNSYNESDPRNGCRRLGTNFRNCFSNEPLFGARADMKATNFSWSIPDAHAGLMRVAAEGGEINDFNELQGSLTQGGFAKLNPPDDLDLTPQCNTDQGVKRRFAERGWGTALLNWDYIYECQFFTEVPVGEHVVVIVSNRGASQGDHWSVYFDGVRVFNHEDSMTQASDIYVGGEYSLDRSPCEGLFTCPSLQTGCIGAGYGVDGTLRWQRARAPSFEDPFTIQSAYQTNNKNKWRMGDLAGGFWIRNRACPPV